MKKEDMQFETLLQRLEKILEEMEDKNTSVDRCMQLFDEGIKLSNACMQKLEQADGKINELKGELENLKKTQFKPQD